MSTAKITITYDNQLHDKSLKSGWGFSCLIEYSGKKILFDTGDNAKKLSFNFDNLRINPEDFTAIVLSHNHWDHTGGLEAVLERNRICTLYFGKSYPNTFQAELKTQRVNFILVKEMRSIMEGVYAGPEMGALPLREIPLTLQTEKGLVIITGCAHPGILKIVQTVKEELGKNVYLVLGGFHLGMSLGLNSILEGLKKIGVEKVGPCHCTGERAISLFEDKFKENFIRIGAGLRIELK